jgi:hypothetical protein
MAAHDPGALGSGPLAALRRVDPMKGATRRAPRDPCLGFVAEWGEAI